VVRDPITSCLLQRLIAGPNTPDVIVDFEHGVDSIDLTAIDANTLNNAKGDQAFVFGGQSGYFAPPNWLLPPPGYGAPGP
jgi:hypothetical protein